MTYRKDSDIYAPYGFISRKKFQNLNSSKRVAFSEIKQCAWIVSHCRTDSQRENYVKELIKYIEVVANVLANVQSLKESVSHIEVMDVINVLRNSISFISLFKMV
jgi:hypothetical protein